MEDDDEGRVLPVGALMTVLFTASVIGAGIGYALAGPAVAVVGSGFAPVIATLWLVWRFSDDKVQP